MIEKLRIFSVALCLMATLSSFAAIISNHQLNEELSNEIVKFEECEEAITEQQQRRRKNKSGSFPHKIFVAFDPSRNATQLETSDVSLSGDRANLNGAGCYLRI